MTRLSAVITPARVDDICAPATRAWLESTFDVRWASSELSQEEVADLISGAEVVLTSWGTPPLPTHLFTQQGGPRAVAHAAGSVKRLLDVGAMPTGVAVFSAGSRIALSVGEYCLGAILTLLRRLPQLDASVRDGGWKQSHLRGSELSGRTVGLVGASSTGRALLRLLDPFDVEVFVYDPYLSTERAAELGVRTASLAEVMMAEIVSVHVPSTPETEGLIGADLIAGMRPGAIFVNSARAAAVDQEALARAVLDGRIFAALDVFGVEPPNLSSPLRHAPHVLLTPHIGGDTVQGHAALAGYVMADVTDWLHDGTRGPSFVDRQRLAVSA